MGLYAINLSVEVSAVLRSEWTEYCPMLSVCVLLVTFHWRWVYILGTQKNRLNDITYVKTDGYENIYNFTLKYAYLNLWSKGYMFN